MVGGLILLWREKLTHTASLYIVAFAAGALLGAAFLDLLPEATSELKALNQATLSQLFMWTLLGMFLFFASEKLLHWWHHHQKGTFEDKECEYVLPPRFKMLLVGDALHNTIDGVVITLSFLASVPAGIATSLAIILHELPQEIADFGVLLHAKMPKARVLIYNLLAALATPVAALLAYTFRANIVNLMPELLAVAAGSFIYIAASDLIPEIHAHHTSTKVSVLQSVVVVLGILAIWLVS